MNFNQRTYGCKAVVFPIDQLKCASHKCKVALWIFLYDMILNSDLILFVSR